MFADDAEPPSFIELGPATAGTPVLLAVPHAGRAYPDGLLTQSRLPLETLDLLSDRHADRLIADGVAAGASAIVATRPRAWIDLNRNPRELDPAMIEPPPRRDRLINSAKVRGGLGLIPRRIAGHGNIWFRPLSPKALAERIEGTHLPYHRAIEASVARIQACFGCAVILDIHSMPPLGGFDAPRVVIGDRGGTSASRLIRDLVVGHAKELGRTALNDPYAGGYTLERHGRPRYGVEAVQIEFDRDLYLASDGRLNDAGALMLSDWLGRLVVRIRAATNVAVAAE